MDADSPRIGFVSLGCPKALVDSERILTQLRAEGYEIVPRYDEADIVVVNTCGFIDEAVEESLAAIAEALAENGRVVVTGCLGVREAEIRATHPQVLEVTGPQAYTAVMQAVHAHLPRPRHPFSSLLPPQGIKLTPSHYAYVKISEGCNHQCTFCIIPDLRGRLVSRSLGDVMREAENLVEAGVRELIVVSQDTSAYGTDLGYRTDFWKGRPLSTRIASLAECLSALPAWVRLHYVYPYPHVDQLIPLMAEGRILPYLDMPLQHASERLLRAMRRPAAGEKILQRLARWRELCPELVVRSTFIVGFPGETEAEFETLLEFLERARLDRVGCFCYSPVQGAAANSLPSPVPEGLKEERRARLMALQARISAEKLRQKVGSEQIVLVDEVTHDGCRARGPGDAPEIDGNIWIEEAWDLQSGDFVRVTITGADTHDLFARPLAPA